jgi:predicted TIM-barrel fold metal-dependent hydrolase
MSVKNLQAIDVHAHIGRYKGVKSRISDKFMTGNAEVVIERAYLANTRLTMVSHLKALLPRYHSDPVAGNIYASKEVERVDGLLYWVVVDPLKHETYQQAEEMLKSPKCAGIKIHPEEHGYPIVKHGRPIFEFAERHNAVVQSHSGEKNSMPEDFVKFANEFPDVKIIISHLGCGWDDDLTHQVRAIQKSKYGNLYTDTSSAKSITPNLIEWAVREIGAECILYGTDSPLYFAPMQRARIDNADISDNDKRLILCGNAIKLFGFKR